MGTTGIESGEVIAAVCRKVSPAAVIAVDALASRSLKRLCRTVQLTGGAHCTGADADDLGLGNITDCQIYLHPGFGIADTVAQRSVYAADRVTEGDGADA